MSIIDVLLWGGKGSSGGGSGVTVDTQLSKNSTNPVQNKAIATEVEKKLDKASVYNGLDKTAEGFALDARQAQQLMVLALDCGTISSLPTTITNANITADMVVLKAEIGNPSAQVDDNWQVVTAAGSATISGTISGSTSLKLYLMRTR